MMLILHWSHTFENAKYSVSISASSLTVHLGRMQWDADDDLFM